MTDRKLIEATVLIMALMVVLIGGPVLVWGGQFPIGGAHRPLLGIWGAAVFPLGVGIVAVGFLIYLALYDTYGDKKGPGE